MDIKLKDDQFNRLFPFHIIIDNQLKIKGFGKSIAKLLPLVIGANYFDLFNIKRPEITDPSFTSLKSVVNKLLIIESKDKENLLFRGEIELIENDDLLFFITPWFSSMDHVKELELQISDFPIHDSQIDILHALKTQEIVTEESKELLNIIKEQKHFYEYILNNLPADIAVFDNKFRYIFLNPLAVKNPEIRKWIIGKTDEEYFNYKNQSIIPAENRIKALKKAIDNKETQKYEEELINNDGVAKYHLRIMHPVLNDKEEVDLVIGYGLNITDRIKIEHELNRIDRLYNVLADATKVLLNLTSKEELYNEVCRIIVKSGDFKLAWIGEYNKDTNTIVPKGKGGEAEKYLENFIIQTDLPKHQLGPAALAVFEGNIQIINDFYNAENTKPWQDKAKAFGLESGTVFPLKLNNKTIGTLIVYAGNIDYFQDKEIELLEELAGIVSLGLKKLEDDDLKKTIENQRKQLSEIIEHTNAYVAITDTNNNIVYINDSGKKALQIPIEEDITGINSFDITSPESVAIIVNTIVPCLNLNGKWMGELELLNKDGTIIPVFLVCIQHKDEKGNATYRSNTAIDITELKKKEKDLLQKEAELISLNIDLRSSYNHLQNIREEERKTIAKEIHDELGQNLTALKLSVSWIRKNIDGDREKLNDKLKSFEHITNQTVNTSRRLYNNLYPQMLDDVGIAGAIQWHSNTYKTTANIDIEINTNINDISEKLIPHSISLALYRIYQECFTNILRYAQANLVVIELQLTEDLVMMSIEDDGKGFDIESVDTKLHHGLLGMRERAYALDGKISIDSIIDKGTKTVVYFPLN